MSDLVPALIVMVIGFALASAQAATFSRAEARLLMLSFAAHVASSFIQVVFMRGVYGGGDIFGYTAWGELLAAAMRVDFAQFAPEVVKMLFHLAAVVPAEIPGQGTSTASMAALAGIFTFVTGGSTNTLGLCVAIPAYFGQVALYRAFRNSFPPTLRRRLLVAALLIPSEVFWSSTVLKECAAMAGLGYLVLGIQRTMQRLEVGAFGMVAAGAVVVSLFKPYILVAVVVALAVWVYYRSGPRRAPLAKPLQFVVAAAVLGGGYAALTRLVPTYAVDNLADQAATYQEVGQQVAGGSTYVMGDPSSRSLAGQLAFAPLALFTCLFRPVLLEARNPQIFVNALETTTILVLFLRVLFRRGVRQSWSSMRRSPILVFAFAFVIVFGIGVGLTTTNLGTLSRYRMPLVPFLWALVLTLGAPEAASESTFDDAKHVPVQSQLSP